jgi:glutaminase
MTDESKRDDLGAIVQGLKTVVSPFRSFVQEQHRTHKTVQEGKVSDTIPELAKANPDWFGICVVDIHGKVYEVGDSNHAFTIQSLANPFVYTLALEDHGRDELLKQFEPQYKTEGSGCLDTSKFLDEVSRQLHDPISGAGALATFNLIQGTSLTDRLNRLLKMFRRYTGHEMLTDATIFVLTRMTSHRQRAMAHLLLELGVVDENVDETLDLFFQQQSMLVTCHDLAIMGATIANKGINPVTGERALGEEFVRDMLSVLHLYGMQEYNREWSFCVGLPARGCINGGLLAIVPQQLAIAVFSPPVNEYGYSVRGIKVCEALSQTFNLHLCDAQFGGDKLREALTEARAGGARSRVADALRDD